MNCADIQERDVCARYVAGRLSAEEEREFEGHLVDCPHCLDAVEGEAGFREGLRLAAPEFAPRAHAPRLQAAVWKWAPPAGFLQVAAGLLLAVSIGLGVGLFRTSADLGAARAERDRLQRLAGQSEQSSAALEQRLAALERRTNEDPAASAAAALVPASVFALTTVRGSSGADASPANRITIDPNTRLVVFWLDLPGTNRLGRLHRGPE